MSCHHVLMSHCHIMSSCHIVMLHSHINTSCAGTLLLAALGPGPSWLFKHNVVIALDASAGLSWRVFAVLIFWCDSTLGQVSPSFENVTCGTECKESGLQITGHTEPHQGTPRRKPISGFRIRHSQDFTT